MRSSSALTLTAVVALLGMTATTQARKPQPRSYQSIVQSVANMVGNSRAQRLVTKHGLQILNVMWEDTGRYHGSSVGPNISDVTIEVEVEGADSQKRNYLMPVIRYPNFSDKTGDVDLDKFFVRVGNQRDGGSLKTIALRELLEHPARYMSNPRAGTIKGGSLLAKRDSHMLVSAQHAFLPIRHGGKATFYPVIFNYQSWEKNPAVLTILVTRQGASMTIIDNNRDTVNGAGSWGQRLYFNDGGQRAPLIAERLQDVKRTGTTSNGESAASLGKDSNLLMIIQVPLKQRNPRPQLAYESEGIMLGGAAPTASSSDTSKARRSGGGSDVDTAVLGHGPTQGPYTELDSLTIERDPRFPIRVTLQFYQATSNGVVDTSNVTAMAGQISRVYANADYVGSLVVPDGTRPRPTEWTGATEAPKWLSWQQFPGLVERYHKYGATGFGLAWKFVTRPKPAQPIGIAQ